MLVTTAWSATTVATAVRVHVQLEFRFHWKIDKYWLGKLIRFSFFSFVKICFRSICFILRIIMINIHMQSLSHNMSSYREPRGLGSRGKKWTQTVPYQTASNVRGVHDSVRPRSCGPYLVGHDVSNGLNVHIYTVQGDSYSTLQRDQWRGVQWIFISNKNCGNKKESKLLFFIDVYMIKKKCLNCSPKTHRVSWP